MVRLQIRGYSIISLNLNQVREDIYSFLEVGSVENSFLIVSELMIL